MMFGRTDLFYYDESVPLWIKWRPRGPQEVCSAAFQLTTFLFITLHLRSSSLGLLCRITLKSIFWSFRRTLFHTHTATKCRLSHFYGEENKTRCATEIHLLQSRNKGTSGLHPQPVWRSLMSAGGSEIIDQEEFSCLTVREIFPSSPRRIFPSV